MERSPGDARDLSTAAGGRPGVVDFFLCNRPGVVDLLPIDCICISEDRLHVSVSYVLEAQQDYVQACMLAYVTEVRSVSPASTYACSRPGLVGALHGSAGS